MKLQVFIIEVGNFKAKVFIHQGLTQEAAKKTIETAFEKFLITYKELKEKTPLLHDFLSENLLNYVWFEVEKDFISKGEFLGLILENPYQIYFDKLVLID